MYIHRLFIRDRELLRSDVDSAKSPRNRTFKEVVLHPLIVLALARNFFGVARASVDGIDCQYDG